MFRLWRSSCPSVIKWSIWTATNLSCKYTDWFYVDISTFEIPFSNDCSWSVWQIHKGGDPLFGFNWICRKSCSGSEIIICSRLLQLFVRLWSPSGLEWPALSSSSSLLSPPSLPSLILFYLILSYILSYISNLILYLILYILYIFEAALISVGARVATLLSLLLLLLSFPLLLLSCMILYLILSYIILYICEAWISVGALEWPAPTLLLFFPSYSPFSHVLLSSFFWSDALSFSSSLAVFFSFYSLFFGELPYPTLLLSSSLLFSSRGVLLILFFLVFSDILER